MSAATVSNVQIVSDIRFQCFAESAPCALAIVDSSETEWSRGQLSVLANQISRALRKHGIARGDVVAIVAPNCAEYMAIYLATMQIGVYLVPVNIYLSPSEIAYILEDSVAVALFAHKRTSRSIVAALAMMVSKPRILASLGVIEDFQELSEMLAGVSGERLEEPITGRILAYTSATTGKPKGVYLPLESASQHLDQAIERRVAGGIELERHVNLCASMLYHAAPLESAAAALHMGHTLVLTESFGPEAVLRLVHTYEVTMAYMIPNIFSRLLRLSDDVRRRYSTSSLRRVFHTGAPCPVGVKQQMIDWWGPILWEAYAGAEGGGTLVDSQEWLRYPGTVGRAIPGTQLKILSDDGEDLPLGTAGTIYMTRYTGDEFEYLGAAEKTRAVFREKFFTLGDVGYLNEEGYLFLCDRKTDVIISNGLNVYPAEVEQELLGHPRVVDCAVFGVPHPLAGEVVMAVVQLGEGAIEERELTWSLRRFLADRLALAKVPRLMTYTLNSLRDATGKVSRARLREIYAHPKFE